MFCCGFALVDFIHSLWGYFRAITLLNDWIQIRISPQQVTLSVTVLCSYFLSFPNCYEAPCRKMWPPDKIYQLFLTVVNNGAQLAMANSLCWFYIDLSWSLVKSVFIISVLFCVYWGGDDLAYCMAIRPVLYFMQFHMMSAATFGMCLRCFNGSFQYRAYCIHFDTFIRNEFVLNHKASIPFEFLRTLFSMKVGAYCYTKIA